MKTHCFKLSDRITIGKRVLTAAACLFSGVLTSSATVTVQGWWHLGEAGSVLTDSSGNGRNFAEAFSCVGGGIPGAGIVAPGCGGPLGNTGFVSSDCSFWTPSHCGDAAMWGPGNSSDPVGGYNPPGSNYVIECYILPQGTGTANGGSTCHFFNSGANDFNQPPRSAGAGPGGVYFMITNDTTLGYPLVGAWVVANASMGVPADVQIGDYIPADTNAWMHLAVVNDNGTNTFYVNGVPNGASTTNNTIPNGNIVCGSDTQGTIPTYDGYLDELRISTFASGAFSTNDLLLRPPGPNVVAQPQNAVVWNGGAAPFSVSVATDGSLTYQWEMDGTTINGATTNTYLDPVVTPAQSGSNFECIVTLGSLSVTSSPAVLTVVTPNPADVAAYRNLVTGESSLLAYFPVDDCTNSVLTNVVNANYNGLLENNATYDGRTNRSFGQRALSFNADGDVEVPNNPAYEFNSGFGTIEALVYLTAAPGANATIVSENAEASPQYYSLSSDSTGNSLIYANNAVVTNTTTTTLTWSVPGGLVGRFVHIALVIDNLTNVTPYLDGQSLGTKQQPSFGNLPGGPLWIGGIGDFTTGNRWAGTIDELAVYSTALSAADIQAHYTKIVFGTNQVPPVITSQSTSKTLLAGGSPALTATVTGGLPLSFQWTSNNIPIAGATSSTFVLPATTTNASASYSLTVSNVFGSTNTAPIVLTFEAPPSGYVTTVMHDNPTAFWRLADTNGPTAVDSAGLNDATYSSSGVTYATGGFPGDPVAGALFNGSSGRAVTPQNFPDINPAGPFTIEFWAALTSHAFYVPLSSMDRPARTSGYEFYIDGNSAGYEFHTAENANYSLITADNNVPPNGVWTYVTGVWDTTNLYLYVNAKLGNNQIDPPAPAGTDNFATEGLGQSVFVPDTSFPFYIASRSDNSHYFGGTMADIAFYNYALTPTQITNHWSAIWTPSQVLSVPTGVTNVEGSTITLTATVAGLPNTYQWYFAGNPLSPTPNTDGTAHYPGGVTGTTLVIDEAKPVDSGEYFLAITNPVGDSVSSNITVLVTPNTVPPAFSQVIPLGTPNTFTASPATPYLVKVVFTKRVDSNTGANPANYSFSPSLTINQMTLLGSGANDITAANLGADYREAILDVTGLTLGQKYSLTVSGVKDQSQTPLTVPTATLSFFAPTLTSGVVNWDYYYLGTDPGEATVSALEGDVNYPNGPMTNTYFTAFDSHQITGGDLNNNPAFGSLGDDYGDVVSGWLTPTVSGDYTFFLDSDDNSELDLSTDSNPLNLNTIATQPGCCNGFVEPTNTTPPLLTSLPVTLVAGHSYFIRALHAEGGGGDYVRVAWRISTDNTKAANLSPIPGSFLSAYETAPPQFSTPTLTNGVLTLNWSGAGTTIQASTNLLDWTNVPGNPSPLVVPVNSGTNALYFRLSQ